MATKWVYIGGTKIGYANKAEVSPDITDAENTPTFDGNIVDVPENIAWTVSVDKVRYGKTILSYAELELLLLSMFKTKKTVRIVEETKLADGSTLRVDNRVYNCVITDKKYTIDAESRTVENLSFKGSPCDTYINDLGIARV